MKKFGMLVAGIIAVSTSAYGYDYKVGALEIDHPWSRAVPKGATVAAGYLSIKNTGTEPDRLVSGSTPVAGKFEIHEMSMAKGHEDALGSGRHWDQSRRDGGTQASIDAHHDDGPQTADRKGTVVQGLAGIREGRYG